MKYQNYVVLYEPWSPALEKVLANRCKLLVTDLRVLICPSDAASLLIVGPPTFSEPAYVIALRQKFDLPVGIISGEHPDAIISRLERSAHTSLYQDVLIDRLTPGNMRKEDGCTLYPEGSLEDAQATLAVLAEEARLLAITTHGRGDAVYLPHLMLCGRQEVHAPKNEYRLPACVHDGDCFYRGRSRFLASHLQARVLFLNSCASFSGRNGLFAEEYALDTAVINNAGVSHLIGSPLVRYGEPAQARFLSLLLNQGFSIGQAITLLDDAITYRSLDVPALLCYGDPAAVFAPTCAGSMLRIDDSSELCEVPPGTALLWFPVQITKGDTLIISGSTTLTVYPTREGFFAFADAQYIPPGIYSLQRTCIATLSKRIQREALEPLQCFKQMRLFDIHPHKMSGRLLDLENRGLHMRDGLREVIVANSIKKLDRSLRQVNRVVKSIDDVVLDALIEKASHSMYHLVEVYRQECQLTVEQPGAYPCAYCQQMVQYLIWQHPIDTTFVRLVALCPRCGYIADQPAESATTASLCLSTPGLKKGSAVAVTLKFAPGAEAGVLAFVLVDTYRFGTPPVFVRHRVECGQSLCQTVLEIPASLPSHNFWLAAYFVTQGRISAWGTNVWLHP